MTAIEGSVMTKMGVKKGLKLFGQAGVKAVKKELQQLNDREVMKPKHAHELTPAQKRASLQYLMLLKKKGYVTIKGRGCADGRKQRETTNKYRN